MQPSQVFSANLALIEEVIAAVCRRARLYGPDAEDFASTARLALIENDYAVLRKWEGRASLGGYLTAVVQRLLIDERVRSRGRWHRSAEAERMGAAGVLLETLIRRDHRTLEEAVPAVRAVDPALTRADVVAMAERLPERGPRPQAVDFSIAETSAVATERTDTRLLRGEAETLARRAAAIVQRVAGTLPAEERTMLELRFVQGMSTPAMARAFRLPQRTLYRRLETLLGRLRRALSAGGVGGEALASILENGCQALDFGFARWHETAIRPSIEEERSLAVEESP
jgi:RNA polymerase sigma factor (sigma-70 family)